jgi:hypothetical protein
MMMDFKGGGADTAVIDVLSLRQDDLPMLDLVRADANQRLAVGAIDGRFSIDPQAKVRGAAGKFCLLERDQTAACRVRASNRQIPFGRRRRIVIVECDRFADGAFPELPAPSAGAAIT